MTFIFEQQATMSSYFALALTEGVYIVEERDSVYLSRPDMVFACRQKKARFYELSPHAFPEFTGYSHAWCNDDAECILLKTFPSHELRPRITSQPSIPYDSIHSTVNPIDADFMWRENHQSDQRETRILHGLASLEEAIRTLDMTDRILAGHSTHVDHLLQTQTQKQLKPQARVSKLMIADAVASEATCPITTNPLTLINAACVAPCYHIFEREAIEKWLESKSTCPECRQPCCL